MFFGLLRRLRDLEMYAVHFESFLHRFLGREGEGYSSHVVDATYVCHANEISIVSFLMITHPFLYFSSKI